MTYNITDKKQLIDKTGITNGCERLDSTASEFEILASRLERIADIFSGDVLAVNNKTMEKSIKNVAETIRSYKSEINSFTDKVQSTTNNIYNRQIKELEDYQNKQKNEKKSG